VHGQATEQAVAGQRTALNVAGATTEELARGMVLASPLMLQSTSAIDVRLSLLKSARRLKDRARVHFYAYTSESIATVAFPGKAYLDPGDTAYARLRLSERTLLLPGDRFIVRQFSPVVTIGGGVILDAAPLTRKAKREDRLSFVRQIEEGTSEQALLARIKRRGKSGLSVTAAIAETGLIQERLKSFVDALLKAKHIVRGGDLLISAEDYLTAEQEMQAVVKSFHESNPLVDGIGREELRERIALDSDLFAAVLQNLIKAAKLGITADQVHAHGRGVVMKDDEAESKRMIEAAFASAGLTVPALKDVLAGLKIDRLRAQKIVTLLLRDKILIKISEDLVFHRDVLLGLRQRMSSEKAKSPKMDVARFKDLTGITRKYAIPLLEYLDREHVTRRVGDERIIL